MKKIFCLVTVSLICLNSLAQTSDNMALVYYNNGCTMISKKNYPAAIKEFSDAIKRDTGFVQAYENRGVAKYYLHDYRGAISDYDKALELKPDDYETFGRRGWARFRLLEYSEAINDFSKALEGKDYDPEYLITMGLAKMALYQYDSAIADFDRAIKVKYGGRGPRSEAYLWRGLAKIESGRKEDGCIDIETSVKMRNKTAIELIEIYCR